MNRTSGKRLALFLVVLAINACTQDKVEEFRITQAQKENGELPDPLAFDTEITFCRFQSSKTGKFVDAGEIFGVFKDSKVRAFVEVKNLEPDKVHSIHLVWLRPGDRKELFRKYVEIRLEKVEGGWKKILHWKVATNLTHFEEEIQEGPDPHVMLDATMTADPERERDLGRYAMRVYFNRELLLEKEFTLIGSETHFAGPANADGAFLIGAGADLNTTVSMTGLEAGVTHKAELTWHDPGGKQFLSKDFEITADAGGRAVLEGIMDISGNRKRKEGVCELRIHLDGSQVGVEPFTLVKP